MPDLDKVCEQRPKWLKSHMMKPTFVHDLKKHLRKKSLHTVCESAKCPNLGECFGEGRAAFMILGDTCTRKCHFCAVESGAPKPINPNEPQKIAELVKKLNLRHVVVTSVTRDDLQDGGAGLFAETIRAIRGLCHHSTSLAMEQCSTDSDSLSDEPSQPVIVPQFSPTPIRIEVLTPDFNGDTQQIDIVLDAYPDILNHNIETVECLTPGVRNKADYRRSLDVLNYAAGKGNCIVKSGMMVGLGETDEEIYRTLDDLKGAGCQMVTIGQYLRPSMNHLPVARYVEPEVFNNYKSYGESIGIGHVFAGPLVRSSYMAEKVFENYNTEFPNSRQIPIYKSQT